MNGFRIINTNCPIVILQDAWNFSNRLQDLFYFSEIEKFANTGLTHLIYKEKERNNL